MFRHLEIFLVFLVIVLLVGWKVNSTDFDTNIITWTIEKPIYKSLNFRLDKHLWRTLTNISLVTTCARNCLKYDNCKSLNYDRDRKLCELNSQTHTEKPKDVKTAKGIVYYEKNAFQIDQKIFGTCKNPRPCKLGEICIRDCKQTEKNAVCGCHVKPGYICASRKGTPSWDEWSNWSGCSVSCGMGLRSRSRLCLHPLNKSLDVNYKHCQGKYKEIQVCKEDHCGYFSPWSEWGECSSIKTCGKGKKERQRKCMKDGAILPEGSKECGTGGLGTDFEYCWSPSCTTPVKLINGESHGEGLVQIYDDLTKTWGHVCSDGFDKIEADIVCKTMMFLKAFEMYTDDKIKSEAFLSNLNCKGNEKSIQSCQHDGWRASKCSKSVAGVRCVVNGEWNRWGAWGKCSVTCAEGVRVRRRECTYPPPIHGGNICDGSNEESTQCNEGPCPVDGVWDEWGTWTDCSASCGGGLQTRNRSCIGPFYGGRDCAGRPTDIGECGDQPCMIPGDWHPWGPWSLCSKTCEKGTRSRARECNMESYGELTLPCIGETSETGPCNDYKCDVTSCTELKTLGATDNTMYGVDPDGEGGLKKSLYLCDVTSDPENGYIVLDHDSRARTHVKGYEGAGEYFHALTYNLSMDDINLIMSLSKTCKQYVKWECKSSSINHPDFGPELKLTYFMNKDGEMMNYWGGAPKGSMKCACGVAGTCVDTKHVCNCDINDDLWREDSGYFDFKDDLPISAISAGDTGGDDEEGYFTIGPLMCATIK